MELHEFLEMMECRETVPAGSEAHELMHRCYAESQRLMLDYNTNPHTDAERNALLCELTGCEVHPSVRVMPRFRRILEKISISAKMFLSMPDVNFKTTEASISATTLLSVTTV